MKRLFLHIGTPKTGTSSVQRFLWGNRELLKEKGYFYGKMPYRYQESSSYRNAHFLIGKVFDENGQRSILLEEKRRRDGFEIMESWFEECDNVILTDEQFWNYIYHTKKRNILQELHEFCDPKGIELVIVVYLRRQDEFASSWWRQRVRAGDRLEDWDKFIWNPKKRVGLNYAKALKRILQDVDPEHIVVRKYERGQFYGGSIYADFLDVIGLELTDEYSINEKEINASFGYNFTELKRIVNQLLPENARERSKDSIFFERAASVCSKMLGEREKVGLLSNEDSRQVLEKYAKSNQQVSDQFFDGEVLFSCDDDPEVLKWSAENKYMQQDMVMFFGELCLNLKQQLDEQNERIRRQDAELKEYRAKMDKLEEDLNSVRNVLRTLHKVKSKFKGNQK